MQEQGVRIIILDTDAENLPAIRFFQKMGFGNVQKHVYMTLNISRRGKKETERK
jgi:ribosomal protein S18 acetylase RimI-like enzyme